MLSGRLRLQKTRLVLAGVLLPLLFSMAGYSQSTKTGGIAGVVKDPSGAVIASATVEVIDEQTGKAERNLVTSSDGTFSATLLTPGTYTVQIRAARFSPYRAVGVAVNLNEVARVSATLQVGQVTEVVVVHAERPLVNTESAQTGQAVDSHQLASLPLPNPNFLFLLSLSAGTAGEPADVRAANRGNIDINVNGQRTTNNSVSLEGINVNDFNLSHFDTIPLPAPDAIAEFKVATSLYDAASGTKGGGALGLVLKSGTKALHWKAYWNHRDDAIDANEWFFNHRGIRKGRLLQNVGGADGSGPAWGIGGFWFANVQWLRATNGLDPNGSVSSPTLPAFPTAADGTTSAALIAPFYGLAPGQIDPVALNILNLKHQYYGNSPFLIPRPGTTGCGSVTNPGQPRAAFSCIFSKTTPVKDTQYTISYDRPFFAGRDKLAVRWFDDNGFSDKPYGTSTTGNLGGPLSFPRSDAQQNKFISVSETHQISNRQINEFRFGFSRFISAAGKPTDIVSLANIGATRPNQSTVPGMYRIDISGLFALGVGVNDDRNTTSNQFYWADNWSRAVGRHTFRAGYDLTRYQLNRINRFAIRGSLVFVGTAATGTTTCPPTCTPLQNFLTGAVPQLQSGAGDPQRYFRATDMSSYLQDDWKVTPRLTLNLGIRWDGMAFSHDLKLRSANYIPALAIAGKNPFVYPAALNNSGVVGTPGFGDCGLPSCFTNNFAPRVGFSWDIFGHSKTLLRGGYGIYYQRLSNQNVLQGSLAAPFFVQLIDNRSNPTPMQLANPIPSQPPTTTIATAFVPQVSSFAGLQTGSPNINNPGAKLLYVNQDGKYCSGFAQVGVPASAQGTNCVINLASYSTLLPGTSAPYNQQWNLGVQRDIGKGWAAEIDYVGAHYVGGLGIYDPYLAPLASPAHPITVRDIKGNAYVITTNTNANEPLRHLAPGLSRAKGGSRIDGNVGFATYHSMQLTLSHRFNNGLYVQTGYTWSKTIDNVSGSQSTDELNNTQSGQLGANFLDLAGGDPRLGRALGDFDRRHRLVISYSYDLPVPRHGVWGSQAFQGWTLSGITTFQQGLPFTVFSNGGGRAYGFGAGLTSPIFTCARLQDAVMRGSVQSNVDHFLNPGCFVSDQPIGSGSTGVGNTPRNAFRGPFQQNWDFSVGKEFRLAEGHSLAFRTDFFNIFNHPAFGQPSLVDIDSPGTFAKITSTVIPARIIQFGLKYEH